jgi:hypothetical protein
VWTFLKVRKEQRAVYSPIVNDLETIQTLSTALNTEIANFSKRWNLFPETQELIDVYKTYVQESQAIYQSTRKSVLSELFAERDKRLAVGRTRFNQNEARENMNVHRSGARDHTSRPDNIEKFLAAVKMTSTFLYNVLQDFNIVKVDNVVEIYVTKKTPEVALGTLFKNRNLLNHVCRNEFGPEADIEISEVN